MSTLFTRVLGALGVPTLESRVDMLPSVNANDDDICNVAMPWRERTGVDVYRFRDCYVQLLSTDQLGPLTVVVPVRTPITRRS